MGLADLNITTGGFTPTNNTAAMYDASTMNMSKFANLTPEAQRAIGASGGVFDPVTGNFSYDSANINSDYLKNPIADSTLGSDVSSFLNSNNLGWAKAGLGAIGLGANLYSTFWGPQSKLTDAQIQGTKLDNKAKEYNYNKTVADNKHMQQVFNPNYNPSYA